MVDLVQILQAVGLTGTLMFGGVALLLTLARAYSSSAKAETKQHEIIVEMALKAQQRAIKLEEARYAALIQTNELTMRVNRLETELQRLPVVEAQIETVKAELAQVRRERDAALVELQAEQIKNSELLGRISQLEAQIRLLEEKVKGLQDERLEILRIGGGDILPNVGDPGAGTDGPDQ